jgi:outer membrane protein OmpA-like peptidoglycan-associated protein
MLSFLLAFVARGQQDTLIIHFDLNRSVIRPGDAELLDSLIRLSGIVSVEIYGHTDSLGSDRHNDSLSLQRAKAVRGYLIARGTSDSLFAGMEGFGRRKPCDPENATANRRVEVIFRRAITQEAVVEKQAVVEQEPVPEPQPAPEGQRISLDEAFRDTTALTGKHIILRNVNFYGDRHTPLPWSSIELNQLLTMMKQHPGMVIRIEGYVCCMPEGLDGRDADNGTAGLSVQRAKFVYDFLVDKGIPKSRMSYKGFGASNKIYPLERSEREKTLNRRVEIRVISTGTSLNEKTPKS